jgi:hypothetical protein
MIPETDGMSLEDCFELSRVLGNCTTRRRIKQQTGRPDAEESSLKGPCMLGLIIDLDNVEATPALLASTFYHIPYPGSEKGHAQRRKYGNAMRSQLDIVRIDQRNGPPLSYGKGAERDLGIHCHEVFRSGRSFQSFGLFKDDVKIGAATPVAPSARLRANQHST